MTYVTFLEYGTEFLKKKFKMHDSPDDFRLGSLLIVQWI